MSEQIYEHMYEDLIKAKEDLEEVLSITRSMAATTDLDRLLTLVIDQSLKLLNVERATLFLYDKPANELVARIATGVKELRVPADKGFCGQAIKTGQTIVIPDAYADPNFNKDVDVKTGFHTRNIMSVPLHDYEDSLVGVLQVLNKRNGAFSKYDITLAETLGAQAGVAIQRASLIEHFLQKKKMQQAMEIAQEIQQGLLPDCPPEVAGFDIAGKSRPADETGGDIFDYIPMSCGRCALVVADATGHGIGPALVVAETRAVMRTCANFSHCDPKKIGDLLTAANTILANDLDGNFVTCFAGLLDDRELKLTYASAGHGPLLFYSSQSDTFEEVPATSLPLAVIDDTDYHQTLEFDFAPGDMAVITTDGVFEPMNPAGEMFGMKRLTQLIRDNKTLPAQEIIEKIFAAVDEFTQNQPQADDITAVIIKRN